MKRSICIATFIGAGLSAFAVADAQQQAPANPPPQRVTVALGSQPQEFLLAKIAVSDLPRSYEFYTRVIGLKRAISPAQPPQSSPTAADNDKAFIEIPLNFSGSLTDPFFVLTKRRGESPPPELTKLIVVGFKVPSVREALARAAAAGYQRIGREPDDAPMAFGNVADPDGYHIEFIQAPTGHAN
jgi:catechol 2,3-dioxygenase-like lactoylglutathione lyase family enzyme